jgi:hypothetical protein
LFLELPGIAGDRTLALARPVKAPSTACGESVGGVSEGPTRRTRSAEQSDGRAPEADATVEGIPVCGMALAFAGQRRKVDLGLVRRRERVPPLSATHRRQRMSRGSLGRERRPHALFEAHAPDVRNTETCLSRSADDASVTWSSDPCTSIATATPSGQLAEVARSNRYRGRANLVKARRNRHRGRGERTMRGSPPVTASARERAWQVKKRKGIKVPVPARVVRAPG